MAQSEYLYILKRSGKFTLFLWHSLKPTFYLSEKKKEGDVTKRIVAEKKSGEDVKRSDACATRKIVDARRSGQRSDVIVRPKKPSHDQRERTSQVIERITDRTKSVLIRRKVAVNLTRCGKGPDIRRAKKAVVTKRGRRVKSRKNHDPVTEKETLKLSIRVARTLLRWRNRCGRRRLNLLLPSARRRRRDPTKNSTIPSYLSFIVWLIFYDYFFSLYYIVVY